jgi:serine/threonine protein kinase
VNQVVKRALVAGVKGSEGQDDDGDSASPSAPAEPSLELLEPAVGSYIDARYRVDGVLGRGGMAVVYAGEHLELQRAVAIKVLDREQASEPLVVEHFLLEARTASALSHPHIVSVSDLGRLPDGRPYLVMPKIGGTDLADLLVMQGPIAPRRAATLLRGVAAALDLIHAKGLLHRDIKCENLMHVANEDGTESLLVLDFGIASASLSRMGQEPGTWSGTPEFMPPEAFTGALADRRADVYALATVAFELITARLPFDCDSLEELIAAKTRGSARTLSQASGVEFDPQLEAVIARGLDPSLEERYSSAGALVDALAAACAMAPEEAQHRAFTIQRARRGRTLVRTGRGTGAGRTQAYGGDIHSMDTQPIQVRDGAARPLVHTPRDRAPLESETRPIATRAEPSGAAPQDPWLYKWSLPKWSLPKTELSPSPSEQPLSSTPPRADARGRVTRASSSPRTAAPRVRRLLSAAALIGFVAVSIELYARTNTAHESIRRLGLPLGALTQPSASAFSTPESVTQPLSDAVTGAADELSDSSDPRSVVRAARLTRDGLRALGASDLGSALDAFERATTVDPRYAPAWHGKGLALDRMGDARAAADAYREFLKLQNGGDDAEKVRKRLWQLSPR